MKEKCDNNVQPANKISIMICEIVCYIVLNIKNKIQQIIST